MVRLVLVHCPKIYSDQVLQVINDLSDTYLFQIIIDKSEDNVQITFKLKDKHLQFVLEKINDVGCGRIYGHIDVMQVLLSRPPISTLGMQLKEGEKKKRKYQINERMTVDEINSLVDDRNHLTFNYMMLMLVASTMAGTGILTDSTVYIIASVLISPLMGPILSITFGLAVNDLATIRKGMRNELIGIGISLAVGIAIGIVGGFIYEPSYRSAEITSRGQAMNLLAGFVVAMCSGVAVVLGVTTGGASALIGTSISASLLAPLVNGAICLAMALVYHVVHDANHDANQYTIWAYVRDITNYTTPTPSHYCILYRLRFHYSALTCRRLFPWDF